MRNSQILRLASFLLAPVVATQAFSFVSHLPSRTDAFSRTRPSEAATFAPSTSSSPSALRYSNTADPHPIDETQVKQLSEETAVKRPKLPNLITALTSRDFERHVVNAQTRSLVIVRYYAPWCRACKKAEPLFVQLARELPHIKFVQVPILSSNADLIDKLGVEIIPWGQIYVPNIGLVTETTVNTKNFAEFKKLVATHVGSSSLNTKNDDST